MEMKERTFEIVVETLTEKIDLLEYQLKRAEGENAELKKERCDLLEERALLVSRIERLELNH